MTPFAQPCDMNICVAVLKQNGAGRTFWFIRIWVDWSWNPQVPNFYALPITTHSKDVQFHQIERMLLWRRMQAKDNGLYVGSSFDTFYLNCRFTIHFLILSKDWWSKWHIDWMQLVQNGARWKSLALAKGKNGKPLLNICRKWFLFWPRSFPLKETRQMLLPFFICAMYQVVVVHAACNFTRPLALSLTHVPHPYFSSIKRGTAPLVVDPNTVYSWGVNVAVGVTSTKTFLLSVDTGWNLTHHL